MRRQDTIKRTPLLETKRLILRPLKRSDAKDLLEILKPSAVHSMLSVFTSPITIQQVKNWCSLAELALNTGSGYMTGIFNKAAANEQLIGYVGMGISDDKEANTDIWEIGYWLDKDMQGHGYATEAVHELVRFAKAF